MSRFVEQIYLKIYALRLLGMINVGQALLYHIGLKTGYHPVCQRKARLPESPYFRTIKKKQSEHTQYCDSVNKLLYFSWFYELLNNAIPDWHFNPFLRKRLATSNRPWWKIVDFDSTIGDIKTLWEASRFDWVWTSAQQAVDGDDDALIRINTWITDWCQNNPAFYGPNWKCGQEAGIRVMHLAMAALLLDQQHNSSSNLLTFVRVHMERIAPTRHYAMAQDNNHGTSEAAALFIGGTWLVKMGRGKKAERWVRLGQYWLENRIAYLVAEDGSFSQYSMNYHRVLIDTVCMVELWRRALNLPKFTQGFYDRCRAALQWLMAFMDPQTGRVPNTGANDGARLIPLVGAQYGDFRPSVRRACALFMDSEPLNGKRYISVLTGKKSGPDCFLNGQTKSSRIYPQGGYVKLCGDETWALIRFANFRFRPSHADCLHLDLWHQGRNILRDGGTFSYHPDDIWIDYFSGTASHNTVQFDDRNQMPRLGRFLFGAWLKMAQMTDIMKTKNGLSWSGAYRDWQKAWHKRAVHILHKDVWVIRDEIADFKKKAVLRWRLEPKTWRLEDNLCCSDTTQISIHTNAQVRRMEIVRGWESLFYHQRTELPVLEIEVDPGKLWFETEITFKH